MHDIETYFTEIYIYFIYWNIFLTGVVYPNV